jgi:ribonucleoside-diphosphate reductase alpha chain
MKEKIMQHEGSIQNIGDIPDDIKGLYKTVWEIKQKVLIDMAAARGPFVCQSQSMNLFIESPDFRRLSSMHFYSWEKGLKTGIYYLRSKAKAKVQNFTLDPKLKLTNVVCEEEVCLSCQ